MHSAPNHPPSKPPPPSKALGRLAAASLLLALSTPASARPPRPASVVYAVKYRGAWRLRKQAVRWGGTWFLTRSRSEPTGLQCTADGRRVLYVQDGAVYDRLLTRKGTSRRIARLPKTIWALHRRRVRAFVRPSPSGRYVALPDRRGVLVYDLQTGKDLLIKPPTRAGSAKRTVRVVHPARWLPDRDALLYLTQEGDRGPGAVNARVFDLIQGRHTLWFPVLSRPVDRVDAFDAVFDASGERVALTLAVVRGRHQRQPVRILSLNPYKRLRLPKGLRPGRVHGFDPKLGDIVLTGRRGARSPRLYSYSFTRRRRRLLDIGLLASTRTVIRYSPARRTALVAAPYVSGKCAGKAKLYKASTRFAMHSLIRWAKWTEIVATDPAGAWFVFRFGSSCPHRHPTLYLMMADGWGLLRDLPRRFAPLRHVAPEQATLCPPTAGRRRRHHRARRHPRRHRPRARHHRARAQRHRPRHHRPHRHP